MIPQEKERRMSRSHERNNVQVAKRSFQVTQTTVSQEKQQNYTNQACNPLFNTIVLSDSSGQRSQQYEGQFLRQLMLHKHSYTKTTQKSKMFA